MRLFHSTVRLVLGYGPVTKSCILPACLSEGHYLDPDLLQFRFFHTGWLNKKQPHGSPAERAKVQRFPFGDAAVNAPTRIE